MPLSGIGLCEADSTTPEVGAELDGEPGDTRGGQLPQEQYVDPGGGQAGHDR